MAALKNKKTSRKSKPTTIVAIEPTPRHVWLASLGTLVAVRRESKTVVQRAVIGMDTAAARLRTSACNVRADLRDGVANLRGQVQPKMMQLSSDVEARLAPIIEKLGLDRFGMKATTTRAPRKGRKPAAKKLVKRRTTRKPAKRVVKKVAR